MHRLRIGFIGGGNMATAMLAGLLRAGHEPTALIVSDPSAAQRKNVQELDPTVRVAAGNEAVAQAADVLVLAVKPQMMSLVLGEIASAARPAGQLIMSIAAGITVDTLAASLGADAAVVRVMPNQPALVGAGMSVLFAPQHVTENQRALARYVVEATGQSLWIADESLMDAVTAVSGSGPAYFYLLMEIMEDCAVHLGLPRYTARVMVRQTALGAAQSAADPAREVTELRASVTSPGGTTAAALEIIEQSGIRDMFRRALTAARDRGAELGRRN